MKLEVWNHLAWRQVQRLLGTRPHIKESELFIHLFNLYFNTNISNILSHIVIIDHISPKFYRIILSSNRRDLVVSSTSNIVRSTIFFLWPRIGDFGCFMELRSSSNLDLQRNINFTIVHFANGGDWERNLLSELNTFNYYSWKRNFRSTTSKHLYIYFNLLSTKLLIQCVIRYLFTVFL